MVWVLSESSQAEMHGVASMSVRSLVGMCKGQESCADWCRALRHDCGMSQLWDGMALRLKVEGKGKCDWRRVGRDAKDCYLDLLCITFQQLIPHPTLSKHMFSSPVRGLPGPNMQAPPALLEF